MSEVQTINEPRRPRRSHRPRHHLDGRTREAKIAKRWQQRWDDVHKKILGEVCTANHGVALSEWQRQQVRRVVQLKNDCEKMEAAASVGETINPEIYALLSEQQARSFNRLGLK